LSDKLICIIFDNIHKIQFMDIETRRLRNAFIIPVIFVVIIWTIKLVEIIFQIDLGYLGVYPLKASGLIGVITSPLIHGDIAHLAANSLPLLVLSFMIFYFYRDIAYYILILLYILPGLWTWFLASEGYHIGASGVAYALASFLFFSGLIRKDAKLMSLSLVVVFLYGSMIWGVIPNFIPEKNISWESHLMGGGSWFDFSNIFQETRTSR